MSQSPPSNSHCNQRSRNTYAMDSFRSCHSPRLREKPSVKSAVGFREQSTLMGSQIIPGAPRPFPGLIDIIQRSQTANGFGCRETSPLALCNDDAASDDPFTSSQNQSDYDLTAGALLVPDVCITPDSRVIDNGCHDFWVAIEISGHLHRHWDDNREISAGVTPQSQEPSCPGALRTLINAQRLQTCRIDSR